MLDDEPWAHREQFNFITPSFFLSDTFLQETQKNVTDALWLWDEAFGVACLFLQLSFSSVFLSGVQFEASRGKCLRIQKNRVHILGIHFL